MSDDPLLVDTSARAARYLRGIAHRRVAPAAAELAALRAFDEPWPTTGTPAGEVVAMLDEIAGPATMASAGGSYYGYVLGATLPVALAADWLVSAWDQSAASADTSPAAAAVEAAAGRWLLEALDLPREAAVGFTTGASTSTLAALSVARRSLLLRAGADPDRDGLAAGPPVRLYLPASVHVSVVKAARVLGIGTAQTVTMPVDGQGRVDVAALPEIEGGIVVLQAGELLTGSFDAFAALVERAQRRGAWVHVDGAFGLWARSAARLRHLTDGVELADSWSVDTHKWLNTPYDGAALICRDERLLVDALSSDTGYAPADPGAQRNRTLEFSRRARGVPVWAALRGLGRDGLDRLVDSACVLARRLADALVVHGYELLNDVELNQVLVRCADDARTVATREWLNASGHAWCSPARWQDRPAMRFSVSSWRTTERDIDDLAAHMGAVKTL